MNCLNLVVVISFVISCSQGQIANSPAFTEIINVQDKFSESSRILDSNESISITLKRDQYYSIDFVLDFLKPFHYAFTSSLNNSDENICHLTLNTKSLNKITTLELGYHADLLDFEIVDNLVFVLSQQYEIKSYTIEFPDIISEKETYNFSNIQNSAQSGKISTDDNHQTLYFATTESLYSLTSDNNVPQEMDGYEGVSSPIVYVDYYKEYLYVSTQKEINIYHVLKNKVRLDFIIDEHFLNTTNPNNFTMFSVEAMDFGTLNSAGSRSLRYPISNFTFKPSERDDEDEFEFHSIDDFLILADNNNGVFVIKITNLFKENPMLLYKIPILNINQIIRYQDYLYISGEDEDPNTYDTFLVYEIFLYKTNFQDVASAQDLIGVSVDELYRINRVLTQKIPVRFLYVDHEYLYMLSDNVHEFATNGINNTFLTNYTDQNTPSMFIEGNLKVINKVFDSKGNSFLLGITTDSINLYSINEEYPRIFCDSYNTSYLHPITYEANFTTINCKTKDSMLTSYSEWKFEKACYIHYTIYVSIVQGLSEKYGSEKWIIIFIIIIVMYFCTTFILGINHIFTMRNYKNLKEKYLMLEDANHTKLVKHMEIKPKEEKKSSESKIEALNVIESKKLKEEDDDDDKFEIGDEN